MGKRNPGVIAGADRGWLTWWTADTSNPLAVTPNRWKSSSFPTSPAFQSTPSPSSHLNLTFHQPDRRATHIPFHTFVRTLQTTTFCLGVLPFCQRLLSVQLDVSKMSSPMNAVRTRWPPDHEALTFPLLSLLHLFVHPQSSSSCSHLTVCAWRR